MTLLAIGLLVGVIIGAWVGFQVGRDHLIADELERMRARYRHPTRPR